MDPREVEMRADEPSIMIFMLSMNPSRKLLWLAGFASSALITNAGEVASDFSSDPGSDWQRFLPLTALGLELASIQVQGGACRLRCDAPSPEAVSFYGFAVAPRVGLFAPETFEDAVASVDVTEWQPTINRALDVSFISVMTRVTSPAEFGNAGGYSFSLEILPGNLAEAVIYRVVYETPFTLVRSAPFPIDPACDYRLVLSSRGVSHTGRVFNLEAPAEPVIELHAIDASFDGGRSGFTLISDRPNSISATFDNFLAWDGTPPPLTIRPGNMPGTLEILADTRRSMASVLETTTDPSDPASWIPVTPLSASESGPTLIRMFAIDQPRAFFRGRGL